MLGAIYGDIAGSVYEHCNIKTKEFDIFGDPFCSLTDDSVMTLAVAHAFTVCDSLEDDGKVCEQLTKSLRLFGRFYPHAGYGSGFYCWLIDESKGPYNSFGNGAAMRCSPAAFAAKSLEDAERLGALTASVTHNHPEGLKAARAVAGACYLAKNGADMQTIKDYVAKFYTIDFTLDEIRPTYRFDVTCQGSVPQSLEAFFESESLEDAVRNAISIGGDSDTVAAIAGSVAQCYYGITDEEKKKVYSYLDERLIGVLDKFYEKFSD